MKSENNPLAPELSADFADRVLKRVDAVRQRRRTLSVVAMLVVLFAGSLTAFRWMAVDTMAPEAVATRSADLSERDLAWMDESSAATSDPDALLFPPLFADALASDDESSGRLAVASAL